MQQHDQQCTLYSLNFRRRPRWAKPLHTDPPATVNHAQNIREFRNLLISENKTNYRRARIHYIYLLFNPVKHVYYIVTTMSDIRIYDKAVAITSENICIFNTDLCHIMWILMWGSYYNWTMQNVHKNKNGIFKWYT